MTLFLLLSKLRFVSRIVRMNHDLELPLSQVK